MIFLRLKKLLLTKKKITGRNHSGKITVQHRGGACKRLYRNIDFKRCLFDVPALVLSLEYDPNRTGLIALILYKNGFLSYILSSSNLKIRDTIITSDFAEILSGNCLSLKNIPIGTIIHNIELVPGKGGQLCRAAGSFGILLGNFKQIFIIVRLASGEEYILSNKNLATIGIVSNENHIYMFLKKAGVVRNLGIRPTVRGVAKNPIDHPHGGGEGKTSGGRPSVSPWGKLTKGVKTRNRRKKASLILKSRHLNII